MATPRVLVLRAPGTNCDGETVFAFERAGARAERIHINRLREDPKLLRQSQILVLPGGFSYGDDVAAGRIFASQLQHYLADAVREFRTAEKLVLGICNGFQILLKAGLLVPPDEDGPLATLSHNENGRFEDRWVRLAVTPNNCVKSASDNGARWVLIVLSRMARAASFSSQLRSSEMKIFGNWPLGC